MVERATELEDPWQVRGGAHSGTGADYQQEGPATKSRESRKRVTGCVGPAVERRGEEKPVGQLWGWLKAESGVDRS